MPNLSVQLYVLVKVNNYIIFLRTNKKILKFVDIYVRSLHVS